MSSRIQPDDDEGAFVIYVDTDKGANWLAQELSRGLGVVIGPGSRQFDWKDTWITVSANTVDPAELPLRSSDYMFAYSVKLEVIPLSDRPWRDQRPIAHELLSRLVSLSKHAVVLGVEELQCGVRRS